MCPTLEADVAGIMPLDNGRHTLLGGCRGMTLRRAVPLGSPTLDT
jgi:hypothetical protein